MQAHTCCLASRLRMQCDCICPVTLHLVCGNHRSYTPQVVGITEGTEGPDTHTQQTLPACAPFNMAGILEARHDEVEQPQDDEDDCNPLAPESTPPQLATSSALGHEQCQAHDRTDLHAQKRFHMLRGPQRQWQSFVRFHPDHSTVQVCTQPLAQGPTMASAAT